VNCFKSRDEKKNRGRGHRVGWNGHACINKGRNKRIFVGASLCPLQKLSYLPEELALAWGI
jgi:hypothetical protein